MAGKKQKIFLNTTVFVRFKMYHVIEQYKKELVLLKKHFFSVLNYRNYFTAEYLGFGARAGTVMKIGVYKKERRESVFELCFSGN